MHLNLSYGSGGIVKVLLSLDDPVLNKAILGSTPHPPPPRPICSQQAKESSELNWAKLNWTLNFTYERNYTEVSRTRESKMSFPWGMEIHHSLRDLLIYTYGKTNKKYLSIFDSEVNFTLKGEFARWCSTIGYLIWLFNWLRQNFKMNPEMYFDFYRSGKSGFSDRGQRFPVNL